MIAALTQAELPFVILFAGIIIGAGGGIAYLIEKLANRGRTYRIPLDRIDKDRR